MFDVWLDINGYRHEPKYLNIYGRPVERTKQEYPYCYDEFVLWKTDDFNVNTNHAVYSDRMSQWGYEKYEESKNKANCNGWWNQASKEIIDKFLSAYFGREVQCTALIEGCNVSNGYPLWAFFYRDCE